LVMARGGGDGGHLVHHSRSVKAPA
jgi:hypothetical protein